MAAALAHPWLRQPGFSQDGDSYYTSASATDVRSRTESYDHFTSSSFASQPNDEPTTPSPSPKVLEECSQDLADLHIASEVPMLDSAKLKDIPGAYPFSQPHADPASRMDIGMPYPDPTKSVEVLDIPQPLGSAWKPRPPLTAAQRNDTITPLKRKDPPQHDAADSSGASSSSLSSPPPLSDGDVPNPKRPVGKKGIAAKKPAVGRRISQRARGTRGDDGPKTPQPTKKRRVVSGDAPLPADEEPVAGNMVRRHSSGEVGAPKTPPGPAPKRRGAAPGVAPRRSMRQGRPGAR